MISSKEERYSLIFDCMNTWIQVGLLGYSPDLTVENFRRYRQYKSEQKQQNPYATWPLREIAIKRGFEQKKSFNLLTSWIDEILDTIAGKTASRQRSPIHEIVVASKYGSFTSNRISHNTARTLAQCYDLPIYRAPALSFYYQAACEQIQNPYTLLFVFRHGQQAYIHLPSDKTVKGGDQSEKIESGIIEELCKKHKIDQHMQIVVDSTATADIIRSYIGNIHSIIVMDFPSLKHLWDLAHQEPASNWQNCAPLYAPQKTYFSI